MRKINVLLPVYNGEKYIREQLDSLFEQTCKPLDIYVRDDGSKDSTMSIIAEYAKRDTENFKFHIIDNEGKNLGYPDCFWELLRKCEPADYYSFCDQDDYWYPEKLEESIKLIEQTENEKGKMTPVMAFCNFDYCDGNMAFVRNNESYANPEQLEFYNGMYYTYAPGFTQVINRALADTVQVEKLFEHKLAHDLWCQWVASACGVIRYDNRIRAHYRRHGDAVTAANISKLKSLKLWWEKEIKGNQIIVWKNSLCYFSTLFFESANENTQKYLSIFASNKKHFFIKIRKTLFGHNLRPTIGGDIALRILMIIGKC